MGHEKLAKAGGEAQEGALVGSPHGVLAGGEPLYVGLQRGVLEVVHHGRLQLHGPVLHRLAAHVVLQEGLHETPLWVESEVSRVRPRLVADQLKILHEADVGGLLLRLPALGHLVAGKPL